MGTSPQEIDEQWEYSKWVKKNPCIPGHKHDFVNTGEYVSGRGDSCDHMWSCKCPRGYYRYKCVHCDTYSQHH